MAIPRRDQIDTFNGGYYHLISRCVRRAFLCGEDSETGRNYDYRREWIENRVMQLAEVFAIEVYAYAVMSNHYHLVVYSDPRAPQSWSDTEVAERWLLAFPGKLDRPQFKRQRELKLQAIVSDKDLLAQYRERLGSLSWLMRCINEPLAKRANAEDFVKGHFFESRFTSQALLDEAAALTCMAYVDLNPIRADLSQTLDESHHTSIQKRLNSMTDEQLSQAVSAIAGQVKSRTMTISLKDYVQLVEWTGRAIIHPGKASIPPHIASTFSQLNINRDNWLHQVQHYGNHFYRVVGSMEKLKTKARQLKQHWLKGISSIEQLYLASG